MQQEDKSNLSSVVSVKDSLDSDKVLERLGHLTAGDVQVTRVPKVVHPAVVLVISFALCHLIVVVWELEIDAACVDIDGRVRKERTCHRRALNMPAGTAFAPW